MNISRHLHGGNTYRQFPSSIPIQRLTQFRRKLRKFPFSQRGYYLSSPITLAALIDVDRLVSEKKQTNGGRKKTKRLRSVSLEKVLILVRPFYVALHIRTKLTRVGACVPQNSHSRHFQGGFLPVIITCVNGGRTNTPCEY